MFGQCFFCQLIEFASLGVALDFFLEQAGVEFFEPVTQPRDFARVEGLMVDWICSSLVMASP